MNTSPLMEAMDADFSARVKSAAMSPKPKAGMPAMNQFTVRLPGASPSPEEQQNDVMSKQKEADQAASNAQKQIAQAQALTERQNKDQVQQTGAENQKLQKELQEARDAVEEAQSARTEAERAAELETHRSKILEATQKSNIRVIRVY